MMQKFLRRMIIKPTHLCHKRRYPRIGFCDRSLRRTGSVSCANRVSLVAYYNTRDFYVVFFHVFFIFYRCIAVNDKKKETVFGRINNVREENIFYANDIYHIVRVIGVSLCGITERSDQRMARNRVKRSIYHTKQFMLLSGITIVHYDRKKRSLNHTRDGQQSVALVRLKCPSAVS